MPKEGRLPSSCLLCVGDLMRSFLLMWGPKHRQSSPHLPENDLSGLWRERKHRPRVFVQARRGSGQARRKHGKMFVQEGPGSPTGRRKEEEGRGKKEGAPGNNELSQHLKLFPWGAVGRAWGGLFIGT